MKRIFTIITLVIALLAGGVCLEAKTTKKTTTQKTTTVKKSQVKKVETNKLWVDGVIEGNEYVDLGLPSGRKWATSNAPSNGGAFYKELGTFERSGNWSNIWKLPSNVDFRELMDNCKWEWTSIKGINGCKIIGPNGHFIFFPAAGYNAKGKGFNATLEGLVGAYLTSSKANPYYAWYFVISSDGLKLDENNYYTYASNRYVTD